MGVERNRNRCRRDCDRVRGTAHRNAVGSDGVGDRIDKCACVRSQRDELTGVAVLQFDRRQDSSHPHRSDRHRGSRHRDRAGSWVRHHHDHRTERTGGNGRGRERRVDAHQQNHPLHVPHSRRVARELSRGLHRCHHHRHAGRPWPARWGRRSRDRPCAVARFLFGRGPAVRRDVGHDTRQQSRAVAHRVLRPARLDGPELRLEGVASQRELQPARVGGSVRGPHHGADVDAA